MNFSTPASFCYSFFGASFESSTGSMTARKYRSSSSGVCFLWPLIHQSTISTKLPEIWLTRKSWGTPVSVFLQVLQ